MLSSLLNCSTLSLSHTSFISKNPKTLTSQLLHRPGGVSGGGSSTCIVHAVEKDSQQFEIDPDEAKAALQQLDKQLQTLSRKQTKTPKIKGKFLSAQLCYFLYSSFFDYAFYSDSNY